MSRPRKQIYTLEMYLKKIKDGDIDNKDLSKFPSHLEMSSDNTLPE